MNYLAVYITCEPGVAELLIAELSVYQFDTFQETDTGIIACCNASHYKEKEVREILKRYSVKDTSLKTELIPDQNWNETWEKNFEEVVIADQVRIRAPFHSPDHNRDHEIIINPKMSFGTGHHETTSLMIEQQLSIDHKGKVVIDIGAGTGVLAIMAAKLGATNIIATDIDEWCISSCTENFELNEVQGTILKGSVREIRLNAMADIVLANINKNILLDELPEYAKMVESGGHLLLSGFYVNDIRDIRACAENLGLRLETDRSKNNWAVLVFIKPSL